MDDCALECDQDVPKERLVRSSKRSFEATVRLSGQNERNNDGIDSPVSSIASTGNTYLATDITMEPSLQVLPPHAAFPTGSQTPAMRRQYWSTVLHAQVSPKSLSHSSAKVVIPGIPPTANSQDHCKIQSNVGLQRGLLGLAHFPPHSAAARSDAALYSRASSPLLENGMTIPNARATKEVFPTSPLSTGPMTHVSELRREFANKLKRFKCQYCAATFAQRGDMMRHIRVKGLLYDVGRLYL
jgi:hypothetical protein